MIYEIQNFLDDKTCDILIYYFMSSKKRNTKQENKFFSGRTLSPSELFDSDIKKRMEIFKSKALQSISRLFHENYVFLEFWDLVHWPEGIEMQPHADNIELDRTPNMCSHTYYSSICYLNHDYEGGYTYFTHENKSCIPEKGKIIFYPSGLQFTHGVSKVIKGDRYTLASWYTKDEKYILM